MPHPQFEEEKPLSFVDVKSTLGKIEKRDGELNYLSKKVKDYLDAVVLLSEDKKEKLQKKLQELNLVRLKEEHIAKIVDFLPPTTEELRIVLQAYPLSLPKKDQESIVQVVKEVL